jgi:hypothetical protein
MRRLIFSITLLSALIAGTIGAYNIIEVPEAVARTTVVVAVAPGGGAPACTPAVTLPDNGAFVDGYYPGGANPGYFTRTATGNGSVTQIIFYQQADCTDSQTVYAGLYDDNAGKPGVQLAYGSLAITTDGNDKTVTLNTPVTVVASTVYHIVIGASSNTCVGRIAETGGTTYGYCDGGDCTTQNNLPANDSASYTQGGTTNRYRAYGYNHCP